MSRGYGGGAPSGPARHTAAGSEEPVVGWLAQRREADQGRATMVDIVTQILCALGVRDVFGIVGGGIAPFADAVLRSPLRLWHTRHEAGAVFAATEAHFATARPSAVFVTTGPGLTNALTGIAAARWDGAKVIVLSGATGPAQRGRWGVQETSGYTMSSDLFTSGRWFDFATSLADPEELPEVIRRLATGLARPGGFVAHLSLPLSTQTADVPSGPLAVPDRHAPLGASTEVVGDCAARLESGPAALWIGYGARHAAREVRALAEVLGAPVMCSPRAKGVFPENHPQFLGVTGAGGHAQVERFLSEHRPRHTLVLGTRLGEVTSFYRPALVPTEAFIHVDLDPDVFGAAYPRSRTIGVQAEVGAFVSQLVRALGAPEAASVGPIRSLGRPEPLVARGEGRVRPQYLMQVLQHVVIDGTGAVVMTESGNSFAWGNNLLRFSTPGRYRTSAAFGAMGHFVTGVVGAALARGGKAVAVVGDGAMLMNNEISTAVKYGAKSVWVVLNDGLYGITHQAMAAQGFIPVETALPATDFALLARSLGAEASRVEREADLERAVRAAMDHDGPYVVDVRIDPAQVTPVLQQRIESLNRQGRLTPAGGEE